MRASYRGRRCRSSHWICASSAWHHCTATTTASCSPALMEDHRPPRADVAEREEELAHPAAEEAGGDELLGHAQRAAEVDQGDEGCGGVEAEAAVADEADAAVEALEATVPESEADGGEDAIAVAADRAGELERAILGATRDMPMPARRPGVPARARGPRVRRAARVPLRAGRHGTAPCWPGRPHRAARACGTLSLSGAFSSDQRVPLIHLPLGVCERSWAFHSSRRTWSTARWARRTT